MEIREEKFAYLEICEITIKNQSMLYIYGKVSERLQQVNGDDVELVFCAGDNDYPARIVQWEKEVYRCQNGEEIPYRQFEVTVWLGKDNLEFVPVFRFSDSREEEAEFACGKFLPVYPDVRDAYAVRGNYVLTWKDRRFCVSYTDRPEKEAKKRERRYLRSLVMQKKITTIRYRMRAKKTGRENKKRIWLISDRKYVANDNGEHFFRYLCEEVDCEKENILPVFAVSKESPDYNRMQQYGKVTDYGGKEYRAFFMNAEAVISSSANEITINPFGKNKKYVADFYNFRYVFLQHGVTKDDISGWLKKSNKNIDLFITAAYREQESIVKGTYGYRKEQVPLTGFARFDALLHRKEERKKKIIILPTWRSYLKDSYKASTSESIYDPNFKDTAFYQFYNSLMRHEGLRETMKKYGYTGLFGLHPTHMKQYVDFESDELFEICEGYIDYQKEFAEASLLVTDYSSTAMDFCYLQKPVIYAQFDREEFFGGHTYAPGYFQYERDGFGPVCIDVEETAEAVIYAVENDCRMEEKYQERLTDFYKYTDDKNCERIYQILK